MSYRIGNFVQHKNGAIIEVESLGAGGINLNSWSDSHHGQQTGGYEWLYPYSDIKPIPLTEEWLLKFGFEKIEWPIEHQKVHGWKVRFQLPMERGGCLNETLQINYPAYELCNWGSKAPGEWNCTLTNTWMKYVHQLQNLYFALTGKELIQTP